MTPGSEGGLPILRVMSADTPGPGPDSPGPFAFDPAAVPTVLADNGDSIPVEDVSSADIVSAPPDLQLPADDPDAPSGVPGLTNAELAERDAFDAERNARRLPVGGGEIPVTFTDESSGVEPEIQTVEGEEDAGRRAALEALGMDALRPLLPEGAEKPKDATKAALVEALLAAGVQAPAAPPDGAGG